jgi:chromosome segregation ATPase
MSLDHPTKKPTTTPSDFTAKAKQIRERSFKLMEQRNGNVSESSQKTESAKNSPTAWSFDTAKGSPRSDSDCGNDPDRLRETIAELQLQLQIAKLGEDDKDSTLQAELQTAKNQVSLMRAKYSIANAELNRIKTADSSKVKELQSQLDGLQKEQRKQADENSSRVTQLQNKIKLMEEQGNKHADNVPTLQESTDRLTALEGCFYEIKLENEAILAEKRSLEKRLDQSNQLYQESENAIARVTEQIKRGERIQLDEKQGTGFHKLQLEIITLQKQNLGLWEKTAKTKSSSNSGTVETTTQSSLQKLQREQEQIKHENDEHNLTPKIRKNEKLHLQLEAHAADNESIVSCSTSMSSPLPVAKAVPVQERFVIDSDMESISSESSHVRQLNLGSIVVNIDPLDRLNWTWVQKMRAALHRQPINIEGPHEQVVELNKLMDDYDASDTQRIKQIANQRKLLSQFERDIEKFKSMPLCRIKTHKRLVDDLNAMIEQDKLNRIRLCDQGQQLYALRNAQDNSKDKVRHLEGALEKCGVLLDLAVSNGFVKDREESGERAYQH